MTFFEPISECDPILRYHDIGSLRHDIVSKFTISDPISSISGPISCTYRVHTVSRHHRYRVFHRYRARYGPDIANNITIYRDRRQFSTTSFPMWNQYRNIPRSAVYDIGAIHTISGPPAPMPRRHWQPPPAGGRAGRRRATAQALQQAQPLDPRHARGDLRPTLTR